MGTLIDWNRNLTCTKLSVPKYKSFGYFSIFSSGTTLLDSVCLAYVLLPVSSSIFCSFFIQNSANVNNTLLPPSCQAHPCYDCILFFNLVMTCVFQTIQADTLLKTEVKEYVVPILDTVDLPYKHQQKKCVLCEHDVKLDYKVSFTSFKIDLPAREGRLRSKSSLIQPSDTGKDIMGLLNLSDNLKD